MEWRALGSGGLLGYFRRREVLCLVRAFSRISFRRECSWDPPPETTLQSSSWSSWVTPRKSGDDDPTTLETPSSQAAAAAAAAANTTAASVEVAVVASEQNADVAPREGVSLGNGGSTNSERDGTSSVVIEPSADEGGGVSSVVAPAALDEEAFFGGSAGSSRTRTSEGQHSTEIQVRGSPTEALEITWFSPGTSRVHQTYAYTNDSPPQPAIV